MDISPLFSLEGRIALITGGSRGIGKMIAEAYLAAEATVYITARKAEACEKAAEELGPRCTAIPGDISTLAGIRSLVDTLGEREGRLDILVNNAGAAWTAPLDSFPESGWDKVMDLNVKSPFFMIQSLLPMLRASRKPAKIINIASIDGQRISPWEVYSYMASKAALLHLTRRLAAELARDEIIVSALAPGPFPSEMNRAAVDDRDNLARIVPLGRIGEAEDIAGAAIFLAARAGDYVVGSALTVDGGIVASTFAGSVE